MLLSAIKNTAAAVAAVMAAAAVNMVVYASISGVSVYYIIKQLSILSLLDTGSVLGNYKNLNLFGFCVDRMWLCIVVSALLLVIFSAVSVISFANIRERETTSRLYLLSMVRARIIGIFSRHTNLAIHEFVRAFLVDHGLLIMAICLVASIITYRAPIADEGIEDVYYRQFMARVQGPADDIADDYWDEQERICLKQLNDATDEEDYERASGLRYALSAVGRAKIHAMYLKDVDGGEYFDATGAKSLLGLEGDSAYVNLLRALVGAVGACVLFSVILVSDHVNDENRIIKVCANGRVRRTAVRAIICAATAFMLWTFCWVMEYNDIEKNYGLTGLDAPARCMEELSMVPDGISLRCVLGTVCLLRYAGLAMVAFFCAGMAKRIKSTAALISVSLSVFALPICFALMGIGAFRYVLLTPLLSGCMF